MQAAAPACRPPCGVPLDTVAHCQGTTAARVQGEGDIRVAASVTSQGRGLERTLAGVDDGSATLAAPGRQGSAPPAWRSASVGHQRRRHGIRRGFINGPIAGPHADVRRRAHVPPSGLAERAWRARCGRRARCIMAYVQGSKRTLSNAQSMLLSPQLGEGRGKHQTPVPHTETGPATRACACTPHHKIPA